MDDERNSVPPAGTGQAMPPGGHRFSRHAVELARIAPGSEVVSRDLETVGRVWRLIFDADGEELVGIVLQVGSRPGEDRELSSALLAQLDDGAVYLSIDRDDLLRRLRADAKEWEDRG